MKTNRKYGSRGGFTLIELLVVIAIIGILASIILVSLNSARKKGNDTRVIADVQQTRDALETGYSGSNYPDLLNNNAAGYNSNGAFANIMNTSGTDYTNISLLNNDANSQGGKLLIYGTYTAAGPATGYAIFGQLVSNNTGYFCMDSTGNTIQVTSHNGPAAANNALCQ